MRDRVLKTIEDYELLSRGDRCILAISGGADSMALLHVLFSLREELGIELRALHVHHGLRGAEADRDADWVQESCKRLGIPCAMKYVKVKEYVRETGTSVEEGARILRYRALNEAAEAWDEEVRESIRTGSDGSTREAEVFGAKIAVAHNLNDDAETILMQMARGSGLKGLGGINRKNGRIIRPLIRIRRDEIEEYLTGIGVSWVTDSTNLDDEYTRNRIRHRVLPELEAGVNTGAAEHIAAAGELIAQAYEYISSSAESLIEEKAVFIRDPQEPESICGCRFPAAELKALPEVMRSTVMLELLSRISKTRKDISAVHVRDAVALIYKDTGKYITLPYRLRVRHEYDDICIEKAVKRELSGAVSENFRTRVIPYHGETVPTGKYTKWFDYDKISLPVEFRCRRPGDYITLNGTGRKSVASYMTDCKIPADRRDSIPIAADGSNVLWIVGYRIGEEYKVTGQTRNVLEIRYNADKGESDG